MEILRTNKRGKKLSLNGYMYVVKIRLSTKIRWECWRRKIYGCKGSVYTDLQDENPDIKNEHNHPPETTGVKIVKAKNTLKDMARTSSVKPSNIISEVLENSDEATRANFPQLPTAKKMIRRQRDPEFPPVPDNINGLEIEDDSLWAKTGGENPQRYKLYDNGRNSNSRIIAFSSDKQLRCLANSDIWFMDGNFKMSPPGFIQLYVIHASLGESSIPAVFAFLEKKNQASYDELFEAINNKLTDLHLNASVEKIICDFEIAVIQSVQNVLGDVQIQGCFYHLRQSTYRKIQNLGLVERYVVLHYFFTCFNYRKLCIGLDVFLYLLVISLIILST